MLLQVLVVCAAACAGALLRWALQAWLNPLASVPLGTLSVNLIGGLLIGIAIAVFEHLPQLDPTWRLLVITGFLGTLTTFSSFSGEVVGMMTQGRLGLALGTVALHLGGSLLMTWVGFRGMRLVL